MSIEKSMYDDMVNAMKTGDAEKRDTLRYVLSEIKKERIDTRKELNDDDVMKIVKSSLKKRRESLEMFKQGNRQDLVSKIEAEIKLVESYLPKQMSAEELEKIVSDTLALLGIAAPTPKDTGRIMKEIMAKYGSQTDGKSVQQILARLTQK